MREKPSIGLVMKSLGAEFFQFMQASAESHAKERGDLDLIPVGTQTQTEVERQIQLVDNFIAQGVDGLLIIPIDSKALIAPIVRAIQSGIKVVNFDVMLDLDALAEQGIELAFLGPDNTEAARSVGRVLAEKIGHSGRVVIIEGIREASNAQQRLSGFLQVVDEYNLRVLDTRSANWETDLAYDLFSEIYEEYGAVEGVMCANDAMASGVVRYLEERGLAGKIHVIGIDNDPSTQTLIENGSMLATIDLLTEKMVAQAIDTAMEALNGIEKSGWIKTETKLVVHEV